MPLEILQLGMGRFTVTQEFVRGEVKFFQGLAEKVPIPEKLVAPSMKGAVDSQNLVEGLCVLQWGSRAVMSLDDPLEIGCRKPEYAALDHRVTGVDQEGECILQGKVLNKMLTKDVFDPVKRPFLCDVHYAVHPFERPYVYVGPIVQEILRAAANVYAF